MKSAKFLVERLFKIAGFVWKVGYLSLSDQYNLMARESGSYSGVSRRGRKG
jgi:hypothetical protein